MDSRRLTYFLTIAEEGSINRAASVLGIAQPALSRQVRMLEDELGITLLHRTARGVTLTDDGERLRAATSGPLRQLELALRYAGSPLARVDRGVHLGLPPTAADVLAVPLLDAFAAEFPQADFRLTVGSTDDIVKDMVRGSIDMAVIVPHADDRLFHGDLLVEDLVVVGAASSGLHVESPISFGEFVKHPIVLPASRSGIRASIENTALRLKQTVVSRFATDSLRTLIDLVAEGHGYGLLPLSACAAEIESRRLSYAPLCEPTIDHHLGIAVTSTSELPRGVTKRATELIRDEVARLIDADRWPARLVPPMP